MSEMTAESLLRQANTELEQRISELELALGRKEVDAEALLDSEKRYRRLFESAKDGILILDAETGRVVDVNPFLLKLLGYSYQAVCGQYLWELGAFRDVAASKEAFNTLQDNEYIRYDDLPLETLDGRLVAVEFVSNVYLVDRIKVIQCNIRDITERKRADAERRRLLAAIEQTGEVIIMTDPEGIIQFVNSAFERSSGYSRAEAVGKNVRLLKSGAHEESFYRELWETLLGGNTWVGQLINKRRDGSLYTEEATISPVRDAKSHVVNFVAVKRDITETLKLTAQFQQAQKMEAVGLLAGGVAHDYNNMLSVILGYADMARKEVGLGHPLYGDLDKVCQAALRSADITRQLLAFARKQAVTPVVLDLNQTVAGIIKMLQRLIGENIGLSWVPSKGLCQVRMDSVQVNQILANLCVNARDAISDIGNIRIETDLSAFDKSYCDQHAGHIPGEFVRLSVIDDGCGMEPEVLRQIFEPFFTTKAPDRGTGLGLSTVFGIVKQNQGFITVESKPGKGTTFRIYLPLHLVQEADKPEPKEAELPRGNGETVLVVEDEPALLMVVRLMLEQLGYHVLTAATPREAFGLAEIHKKTLVLLVTDMVMPEMNGRDLSEHLRSLNPRLKCLFMSGYTANVIFEQGRPDGGVNFLEKPFSIADLATRVRDSLSPLSS